LLRFRERPAHLRVGLGEIASEAEHERMEEPRLDLPPRMAPLAEERPRPSEPMVGLFEAAQLRERDAQVEREGRLFVVEAGIARLKLAARELAHSAVEFARSQEAEAEQIPRAEHSRRVLEIPSADVVGGAEMLFRPRRASDAPDGAARSDVELEEGAFVVRMKGVELGQLLLGDLGDFLPPAE